jgi:hypothetical protein
MSKIYNNKNLKPSPPFFKQGLGEVETRLLFNWCKFLLILFGAFCLQSCGNDEKAIVENVSYETVAPIIFKNCTPCHRPTGAAHFSLTNYTQIKKYAKRIKAAVESRYMPPWPADINYTHFVDEKYLTESEIKLTAQWVEAGTPHGDTSKTIVPDFPEGSYLGKPDLVVTMPKFEIKGDNIDKFLLMKMPFELPENKYVRAVEFVPGNKKVVHHVNGHLIKYDENKCANIFKGDKIVNAQDYTLKDAYNKLQLANDDGSYPTLRYSFVNYLPGVQPTIYPEGIGGFNLNKKNAILFKEIHYGPSTVDTSDVSYCNLFFADKAYDRPTLEMQLGTWGESEIIPPLMVPPNEVKTFYTQTIAKMDMSILTINPHMHLLGKSFWAFAITPMRDTIPLIRINKWDFRWQYFYTFKKMVKIPAGSLIKAIGTFDNTSTNIWNPNVPPKPVGEREGSMRTTDEMFQFIITYLPYVHGDEAISLEGNLLKQEKK